MAINYNTSIVRNGLQIYLDIENIKSYPGTGTTWTDMINNITFIVDNNTPDFITNVSPKYVDFEESSNPGDNLKSTTGLSEIGTQLKYTRCAWFNLESLNSTQYRNIFCNVVGNNSDMSLCVQTNNKFGFHQYVNSNGPNTAVDYTVTGNTTLEIDKWYYGCVVVDRENNTINIYLNGEKDVTQINKAIGNSSSDIMLIGGPDADSYSGDRMFDGKIAVVQHYNRALSDEEIKQNFESFRGRYRI
jgi:hypothetical protein